MIDSHIITQLATRPCLHERSAMFARSPGVPASPGLYAWYFRDLPPGVPRGSHEHNDFALLYVGTAPTSRASKQTLRSRLRQHMCGNASGSTLRLTLGCLLAERLGLSLRPVGKAARLTFGAEGEQVLSKWLDANARVAWVEHPEPWDHEPALIAELSPPLNLDHNSANPFAAKLREVRRTCRAKARGKAQ